MLNSLLILSHISINSMSPGGAYVHQGAGLSFAQVMPSHLIGTNLLTKQMPTVFQWDNVGEISVKL